MTAMPRSIHLNHPGPFFIDKAIKIEGLGTIGFPSCILISESELEWIKQGWEMVGESFPTHLEGWFIPEISRLVLFGPFCFYFWKICNGKSHFGKHIEMSLKCMDSHIHIRTIKVYRKPVGMCKKLLGISNLCAPTWGIPGRVWRLCAGQQTGRLRIKDGWWKADLFPDSSKPFDFSMK